MTFQRLAYSATIAATLAAVCIAPCCADMMAPTQEEAFAFEIPLEAAPPPEQLPPAAPSITQPFLPVPTGRCETVAGNVEDEETTVRVETRSERSDPPSRSPKVAEKKGKPDLSRVDRLPLTRSRRLSRTALTYRGTSYRWGGFSRLKGFDCSGLTRFLYLKEGIDLPHSAKLQFRMGKPVEIRDLKSGDLVFFNTNGPLSHVGMYIGNGCFVHAANPRRGVTVNSLSDTYYKKRYAGARTYMH